ncbi:cysteine desulfurase [Candidatus Wolfebacteria bacterium]|nr:cysteine desulfurase [Candidatus Wolfebacteria bacterium]
MNKIYLDYAATTPIDPLVKKAMEPYFFEKFGNPSSLHSFGQEAMSTVDKSREKISKILNADFREIIFTGSATEANNLAIRGVVKSFNDFYFRQIALKNIPQARQLGFSQSENGAPRAKKIRPLEADYSVSERQLPEIYQKILPLRIIVSSIEHESILDTCRDLEKNGVEIIHIPVNREGIIDLKKLKSSLNERTILVSIMYANNEIGTIQPIAKISKIINEFKARNFASQKDGVSLAQPLVRPLDSRPRSSRFAGDHARSASETLFLETKFRAFYPLFHTDAVQAFQFLDCDVNKLGVDLITLSAHKIYGPKGIGLLYARAQNSRLQILSPIITGGGQEFGLRSGTENVPSIIGFNKAIELADKNREKETKRISELSDYFWREIKKIFPKAEINGFKTQDLIFRVPNIINICFPDQKADGLLMKFDFNGIAVSSGSACSARASKISHVLKAMEIPENKIKSSLRFSFGKFTTKKELTNAIKILNQF